MMNFNPIFTFTRARRRVRKYSKIFCSACDYSIGRLPMDRRSGDYY